MSPCSWCLSWCCCSSYARSCALIGSSSSSSLALSSLMEAKILGDMAEKRRNSSDQWQIVANLGGSAFGSMAKRTKDCPNPWQMAWQRQIKWGEDRQTTYKCCVYCALLLRVCVVVCVLLRCVLMRQPVTELRTSWDGREGWCLAKASEGWGAGRYYMPNIHT